MNKKELREYIKSQKGLFSSQQLKEISMPIIARLTSLECFKEANNILLYYSLPDEVYTHSLISELTIQGKNIFLPFVKREGEMSIRPCLSPTILKKGAYNIMEPTGEDMKRYEDIEIAVVPGVAFDVQNHRLGRGKGYYDRFLPKIKSAVKIGLAFRFQMFDTIPVNSDDVVMDMVIHS